MHSFLSIAGFLVVLTCCKLSILKIIPLTLKICLVADAIPMPMDRPFDTRDSCQCVCYNSASSQTITIQKLHPDTRECICSCCNSKTLDTQPKSSDKNIKDSGTNRFEPKETDVIASRKLNICYCKRPFD